MVYRNIENGVEARMFQNELKVLEDCCDPWEMSLNIVKCEQMCFSRCKSSPTEYKLKNVILAHVEN